MLERYSQDTLSEQMTTLETDLRVWHERMEGLKAQGTTIIAFRGAGSANGIEPEQL